MLYEKVESVPPSTMCIKVLLADDTVVMRNAIRTLLGGEPEIELVAEAENFAQSLSLTRKFKPHVVILDLHMPDSSNLTPMNVSEVLRAYEAAVLAISVWHDEDTWALARSYGAAALLNKMRLGQELIPAVMKLGSGSDPAGRARGVQLTSHWGSCVRRARVVKAEDACTG
jgi:DNA-binding NarL/FixJ family response regulator